MSIRKDQHSRLTPNNVVLHGIGAWQSGVSYSHLGTNDGPLDTGAAPPNSHTNYRGQAPSTKDAGTLGTYSSLAQYLDSRLDENVARLNGIGTYKPLSATPKPSKLK